MDFSIGRFKAYTWTLQCAGCLNPRTTNRRQVNKRQKKSLKDRNLIVHCIADNVLVKKPIAKELLDEETWEETGHWYALSSTGKWVKKYKAFRNY